MKTRLLTILYFILFASFTQAQHKRAFLVGISNYDTDRTGYQWNNINGTEDILLISPILKKQGFFIETVLDDKATYKNIINRLKQFTTKCQKGDIVYIHFSCHGQPVEDLNNDEEDGWDEALVPIDAYKKFKKGVYEGGKHILDDHINQFVRKIRTKIGSKGFLYVIIDACHAGTSSRGSNDITRGTHIGFTYNNKIYKPTNNKKHNYKITRSKNMAEVMFIEACRADQVNTEIKVSGKRYGPLSYNITLALKVKPLDKNASVFLNNIKKSIIKQGKWPFNQNLVTETSF